jgi:hypothetical protein
VRLDPALAAGLATRSISSQVDRGSLVSSSVIVTVAQDGSEVTVSADGRIELTLLRLLARGPLVAHVSSTAAARKSP